MREGVQWIGLSLAVALLAVGCDDQASAPRGHFEGIVGEPHIEGGTVAIAIEQPNVDVEITPMTEGVQVIVNGRTHEFAGVTFVAVESLDPTATVSLTAHAATVLDADRHGLDVLAVGYAAELTGFRHANVSAVDTPGSKATVIGTPAEDELLVMPDYAKLEGHGYSVTVDGFTEVSVEGFDGRDGAKIYDSPGDDMFTASTDLSSVVYSSGAVVTMMAFEDVVAIGSSGEDQGLIIGTDGRDLFGGTQGESRLVAQEQAFDAHFFNVAIVDVLGAFGDDEAEVWDTVGDDLLVVDAFASELMSPGFGIGVGEFDRVIVHGTAGGQNTLEEVARPIYTLELDEGWAQD